MIIINILIIIISCLYAIIFFKSKCEVKFLKKYNLTFAFLIFIGLCFSINKLGILLFNKYQKNSEKYLVDNFYVVGDWCVLNTNSKGKILHIKKNNYQIINERSMSSAGYLTENKKIVAEGWGNLLGDYQGANKIVWSNGTIWVRCN